MRINVGGKGDFMGNKDKLISFLSSHYGYVTTSELLELNIYKPQIQKYIDAGIIEKVSHGLYMSTSNFRDEYYILQKRYPDAIFSYNTAFHILNLTNRVPMEIDITVCRGKRVNADCLIHYVSENYYGIGIIEVLSPFGNPIKVYNAERSICDMLRTEGDIDLELQNRILNYYFSSKDKNIDLLFEYAKIFNIYEKVKTIVEVTMKW